MDEHAGTGPGAITSDGCAVEFYALLPAFGEAAIVHAAVPPGASVLELGCGTGRILRPLAALGHPVTGVDDSQDMLARSPDLPTVCSAIESLRLDRQFDVVLLASTMINSSPGTRRAFLATVRHHLRGDGIAVFQRRVARRAELPNGAGTNQPGSWGRSSGPFGGTILTDLGLESAAAATPLSFRGRVRGDRAWRDHQ